MDEEIVLPVEIIRLIVQSISDPATAARCLGVCSRWKSSIDRASFWRELYYSSIVPKKFEVAGDLPSDHRLNTPFWKNRVILTYGIQKSIKKQKCLPRIIASTVIDANRTYHHPRVQSFNKTHCAITWEYERPMDRSTDNLYLSELMKIGANIPSQCFDWATLLLHGDYVLFCNVTPYRNADLSSIRIVRFNPNTYHNDLDKPTPDPLVISNACKMAKHVDRQSKYFVVASYEGDQCCTVNVVDLDKRQIVFTEEYKGRYTTVVACGTKFALLTNLGVIVVDFISKQIVFSSKVNATDALLFEDTIYILEKKRSIMEVQFSGHRGGNRRRFTTTKAVSKIFMYQGMFVLVSNSPETHALYFYTPSFEQVAEFILPHEDVADVVTLGNGNMVITFEDDGAVFNVSFNPKDTEQLVELDLVEPNGNVKSHVCSASDLLESFRMVNQQGEAMDGVTSLYIHTTGQKRYGMLLSVIPNQEVPQTTNEIAEKLIEGSAKRLSISPQYKTPFRNVGFAPFQSVRRYGINQPKRFQGTIGIFCEQNFGEWFFVKPDTNEWKELLKQ